MRKYYPYLGNDEKQQVANCFNKMYGEHLGKARSIIEKVENRYRENKWSLLWADISLKASKNLQYVIPFEDYVSLWRRVSRHRENVIYTMKNDHYWGEKMIMHCAQSSTNSVTINDECNGRLEYSGEALFNMIRATA